MDTVDDIKALSRRYRTPVAVRQGVVDQHKPGGGGLLQKSSTQICISAIKRHELRDTLLVRLYNLTGKTASERLVFGRELRGAWLTNLLEERTGELRAVGGNTLELNLGPHAILTVEVAFDA